MVDEVDQLSIVHPVRRRHRTLQISAGDASNPIDRAVRDSFLCRLRVLHLLTLPTSEVVGPLGVSESDVESWVLDHPFNGFIRLVAESRVELNH